MTRRGHPFALLVPISEEDLDRVRRAVRSAKLRSALEDLWEESQQKGTDAITMEKVDAEIRAYKKEKSSKSRR